MKKKPRISIIGAGPGDPELITVKALNRLKTADVILYDALVNKALLKNAPTAKKIFVGKRSGKQSTRQEDINYTLVQSSYTYGHAVRLKGGDPFIFGRGHEELAYVQSFGIDVEVVPGLSSATSISTLQHIPLTKRGINESFYVITGTTRTQRLSKDISIAAQTSATIVILMGIKKISIIRDIFIKNNKQNTPVMVVQSGSTKSEKYVVGNIDNIVQKVNDNNIQTPGIIVIGETVGLHNELMLEQIKNNKWNR